MTQAQLAERSGLSADAIGLLERGERRRPQRNTVDRLAAALGLEADRRREFKTAAAAVPSPPRRRRAANGDSVRAVSRLPAQMSSFVGRRAEVKLLERLVRQARLVTLAGFGGVGKTRLAHAVASRVERTFTGGIWLVDLTSFSTASSFDDALRSALEIDPPVSDYNDILLERQANGPILIVLDNCEPVIEDVARAVHAILNRVPKASILCTSREPLNLDGEHTFRVTPLGVAPAGEAHSLAGLRQYEGVELFLDRLSSFDAAAELGDREASAVADIVLRLDGIPLAIELGAARAHETSVGQLARELAEGFGTLQNKRRFAAAHHTTMEATIAWSYRLLSPDERCVLRRLSVFLGGWTLDAAQAACSFGDLSPAVVAQVLQALTAKSLAVRRVVPPDSRYMALEPVRQYAASQLSLKEAHETGRRHATYFLELIRELTGRWPATANPPWPDAVNAEAANLRTAREWLFSNGSIESGAELAAKSAWFFNLVDPGEGERTVRRALSFAAGSGTHEEALLLTELAWRDLAPGERREAAERAVLLLRKFDDRPRLCRALFLHARVIAEYFGRDLAQAEASAKEAHSLSVRPAEAANALMALSACVDPADVDLQRDLIDRSCAEFAKLGSGPHSVGLRCAGEWEFMHGNTSKGIEILLHARRLAEAGKIHLSVLGCNADLAVAYTAIGNCDEARACVEQTILLAEQIEYPMYLAFACQTLAQLVLDAGDAVTAARLFGCCGARIGRLYPPPSPLDCHYAQSRRLRGLLADRFDEKELRRLSADGAAWGLKQALEQGLGILDERVANADRNTVQPPR